MTADSFLSMLRPCAAGRAAVLVIFAFWIETLPALVPTRTPVYGLIGASHAWRRAGVPTATALPQRPSSSQQQEQQEQQQPADVRSGSVAIIFRQASPYDFPDVGALRTAVFAPHLTMAQSRRLQNSIFERAMAAKEFVVLAEAKQRDGSSEVIGAADLAVFSLPDGPYRKRLAGYITNVAVSPRAQRLGVGRGLLTTLCARRPAASSSFNRPNDATRLVADLAVRPMPHAPRSPNPRPPAHGSRAHDHREAYARDHGLSSLGLHVDAPNVAALRLYRGAGFTAHGAAADDALDDALARAYGKFVHVGPRGPLQLLMSKPLCGARAPEMQRLARVWPNADDGLGP